MEDQHVVDVLLVEDRSEDAELALLALKKHNFVNVVNWVKDGEEALEYVFAEGRYKDRNIESRPKLILLDLKMPKVDGIEVLRRIRADDRVKHIPVVVLTTSKEEQDITNAYNLHVNAYMLKPVEFHNFIEAVKTMGMFWVLLNQRPY
ncbi:MAG: response regulator [Bacteroidota bacterium]